MKAFEPNQAAHKLGGELWEFVSDKMAEYPVMSALQTTMSGAAVFVVRLPDGQELTVQVHPKNVLVTAPE